MVSPRCRMRVAMPSSHPPVATRPLRCIVLAADARTPASVLASDIAEAFSDERLDILLKEPGERARALFLSVNAPEALPAEVLDDDTAVVHWLTQRGYRTVLCCPVFEGAECVGAVVLAHCTETIAPEVVDVAVALAGALEIRYMALEREQQIATLRRQLELKEGRLVATERLRRQAAQVAGAAHDLGNFMSVILGNAEILSRAVPAEFHEGMETITRAARDARKIIRRALTRDDNLVEDLQRACVPAIVPEVVALMRPLLPNGTSIRVVPSADPAPPVEIDPTQLREVLTNLILNAVAAMPEGGTIEIRSRSDDQWVSIEVHDTGVGVSSEQQEQIFEPGYSTRPDGSGLGLSVSRTIVEQAGGKLCVTSAEGMGTTFTIVLPIAQDRVAVR